MAQQTSVYSDRIKNAAAKVTSQSSLYPPAGTNKLAYQLKIVSQLIAGGLRTRVYVVNLGGVDTHSGQVDGTAGTGVFSVNFDASSLPAGIYFYKMTSGGFQEVKTMNLVK